MGDKNSRENKEQFVGDKKLIIKKNGKLVLFGWRDLFHVVESLSAKLSTQSCKNITFSGCFVSSLRIGE